MKIFISWSGRRSRIIAEGLNNWLPKLIQAVKPFYSPEIEKGTRGISQINETLEGTNFGIICLTPDNLQSTWIHYEAGALSKIEGARIWTLLHGLNHSDVAQPLAQFQHTLANRDDIYKLIDSINKHIAEPLDKGVLRDSFERWWSDLEEILKEAEEINKSHEKDIRIIRSDREVIDEILEILRDEQRTLGNPAYNAFGRRLKLSDKKLKKYHLCFFPLLKSNTADASLEILTKLVKDCFQDGQTKVSEQEDKFFISVNYSSPTNQETIFKGLNCLQENLPCIINGFSLGDMDENTIHFK
jgi:hypothetical protein